MIRRSDCICGNWRRRSLRCDATYFLRPRDDRNVHLPFNDTHVFIATEQPLPAPVFTTVEAYKQSIAAEVVQLIYTDAKICSLIIEEVVFALLRLLDATFGIITCPCNNVSVYDYIVDELEMPLLTGLRGIRIMAFYRADHQRYAFGHENRSCRFSPDGGGTRRWRRRRLRRLTCCWIDDSGCQCHQDRSVKNILQESLSV